LRSLRDARGEFRRPTRLAQPAPIDHNQLTYNDLRRRPISRQGPPAALALPALLAALPRLAGLRQNVGERELNERGGIDSESASHLVWEPQNKLDNHPCRTNISA
jgi:hypothetical protein